MGAGAVINDYGTIRALSPRGYKFTLGEVREITESKYVERVIINEDCEMWMDEDGKMRGLSVNKVATEILRAYVDKTDFVVGTVFLCSRDAVDLEGCVL